MPRIEIITNIAAPVERCFDLARSIDLHKLSTEGTKEEAIEGITSGLIGKEQQVTWRARHFGITQTLSSKITGFERPFFFRDEMIKGAFKSIRHDHVFQEWEGKTIMKDLFYFESRGGLFGVLFNQFILKKYLRSFLLKRNEMIKRVAEGDDWSKYLNIENETF